MPYTKTLQLRTWKAFRKVYRYLQNKRHKNHLEYDITRMLSAHPEFAARQLRIEIEKTFRKITVETRNGRPIEVLFDLHISRMPLMEKAAWCTPAEREEYARRYINVVAPDGLALYCWHCNRLTGEDDLNVLVANIIDLKRPRSRRRPDVNRVDLTRDTADAVTEILNEKRRAQGRLRITTMPERLRQIDEKRMGTSLEEKLARHPVPVYLQNLRTVVEEMGHEVSRYSEDGDYISIRFANPGEDKEKARKRKARRFRLTSLLGEVSRLRKKQQERTAHTEAEFAHEQMLAAKQAAAFQLPRDEDLERLIDEWSRERNPHTPEPPQEPPQPPRRTR